MTSTSDLSDQASPQCDCRYPCFDVASGVLMKRNGLTRVEARGTMWRFAQVQDVSMHAVSGAVLDSTAGFRPLRIS
jgi:hypothetical protein